MACFWSRRHPPEDRALLEDRAEGVGSSGSSRASTGRLGVRHPGPGGDRRDGQRAVPRDHLRGDALTREVRKRRRGVVAHAVRRRGRARRARTSAGSASPSRRASLRASTRTRRPVAASCAARRDGRVIVRAQDHLRRAQNPSAEGPEVAALHLRAEEKGTLGRRGPSRPPAGRPARAPRASRWRWRHRRQRPEGRVDRERAIDHLERVEDNGPVGEGAGLVEAHDVDAGQRLDRRELLDQHVAAGERQRPPRRRRCW